MSSLLSESTAAEQAAELAVTSFASVKQPAGRAERLVFRSFFDKHLAMPAIRKAKDGPLFSLAKFKNNHRCDANVEALWGAVLDFDNTQAGICDTPETLSNELNVCCWAYYTTWSHTKQQPKFRAIVPFKAPVPTNLWNRAIEALVAKIGSPAGLDLSCRDKSRCYYLPACPLARQGYFRAEYFQGQLLDPAELLEHPIWDIENLPAEKSHGRNNALKAQVSACLSKGVSLEEAILQIVEYDLANHNPPLFTDTKEGYLPNCPEAGAMKFVSQIWYSHARNHGALPKIRRDDIRIQIGQTERDRQPGHAYEYLSVELFDLLQTEPPNPDQIISKTFDRGDKLIIVAASKTYKSWLINQLAICLSDQRQLMPGSRFLGLHLPKPRKVIVFQFEVQAHHNHARFKKMAEALNVRPDDVGRMVQILNLKNVVLDWQEAVEAIKRWDAEVCIFDPLYKLSLLGENSAEEMKKVAAMLDRVMLETKAAVIITHHDIKGNPGDRDIRDRGAGSNVLVRDADAVLTLTRHAFEKNTIVVETLLRNYPDRSPFSIRWQGSHFDLCDAPALPETSHSKQQKRRNLPIEICKEQALSLFQTQQVLPIDEARQMLADKLGLGTRGKGKAVIDSLIGEGILKELSHNPRLGLPKLIGRPSAIQAEAEQRTRQEAKQCL